MSLPLPGFLFSISILSGCFDLLLLPNFFYQPLSSPPSLFDNADSAIIEGNKHTKQGCSFTDVNEGHRLGHSGVSQVSKPHI